MTAPKNLALRNQARGWEHQKEINEDLVREHTARIEEMDRLIDGVQKACPHDWAKPERHSEHLRGYHIPAVMQGSDSTPSVDVPPPTEVWYTRTCRTCGKTERNEGTKPAGSVPVF